MNNINQVQAHAKSLLDYERPLFSTSWVYNTKNAQMARELLGAAGSFSVPYFDFGTQKPGNYKVTSDGYAPIIDIATKQKIVTPKEPAAFRMKGRLSEFSDLGVDGYCDWLLLAAKAYIKQSIVPEKEKYTLDKSVAAAVAFSQYQAFEFSPDATALNIFEQLKKDIAKVTMKARNEKVYVHIKASILAKLAYSREIGLNAYTPGNGQLSGDLWKLGENIFFLPVEDVMFEQFDGELENVQFVNWVIMGESAPIAVQKMNNLVVNKDVNTTDGYLAVYEGIYGIEFAEPSKNLLYASLLFTSIEE